MALSNGVMEEPYESTADGSLDASNGIGLWVGLNPDGTVKVKCGGFFLGLFAATKFVVTEKTEVI